MEVEEIRLRSIVLGRLEGNSSRRFAVLRPGEMPLDDLMHIDAIRSALGHLYRSRQLHSDLAGSPDDSLPVEDSGVEFSGELLEFEHKQQEELQ